MPVFLPIPHFPEAFEGGCLPACCQMVLAYQGIARSQHQIAAQIGHIAGAGAPARNVLRLSRLGVAVDYRRGGSLADLREALIAKQGVIAFVRTGELPYWLEDTAHALVVVGLVKDVVYVNDPAFEHAPIAVPAGDFELAWESFGSLFATIR